MEVSVNIKNIKMYKEFIMYYFKVLAIILTILLLSGCGQLNREYTLNIDAEEDSKVDITIKVDGVMVDKVDSEKADNTPDISPELDIPLM